MIKLRHWLTITFLIGTFFPISAPGQSSLTLIRDTVYQPNGTPFQGTVVITWVSPSTPTGSSPAPNSTSVKIYNGALSVLLVPTTSASTSAYYQAIYNSSDGLVSWTEAWQVPSSVVALSLSSVRTTATGGSGSGSNGSISISQVTGLNSYLVSLNSALTSLTSAENTLNSNLGSLTNAVSSISGDVDTLKTNFSGMSTTVNGYGASISGLTSDVAALKPSVSTLTATVSSLGSSLSGVSNDVATLKSSSATLTSTVSSLGTTVNGISSDESALRTTVSNLNSSLSTVSAKLDNLIAGAVSLVFIDAETPGGTVNGSNAVFSLANAPSAAGNLSLYRNGIMLSNGKDFTLSGNNITFLSGAVPQSGDSLQAFYRINGSGQIPSFVDSEVPLGTIDGSNRVFTIANAPTPAASLKLYRNGVLVQQNSDYTLSGKTINFIAAATPQAGDALLVAYRTL